jgi:hypothetical protein
MTFVDQLFKQPKTKINFTSSMDRNDEIYPPMGLNITYLPGGRGVWEARVAFGTHTPHTHPKRSSDYYFEDLPSEIPPTGLI